MQEQITTVYVRLFGEGADCARPVFAHFLGGDRYKLLEPDDYDPEDEIWEFNPGSVVRCAARTDYDRDKKNYLLAITQLERSVKYPVQMAEVFVMSRSSGRPFSPRAAVAQILDGGHYKLTDVYFNPKNEEWQFQPGDTVTCAYKTKPNFYNPKIQDTYLEVTALAG